MKQQFVFTDAFKILQIFSCYSQIRPELGSNMVLCPFSRVQLSTNKDFAHRFQGDDHGAILQVKYTKIMDIKIEHIGKGVEICKLGSFNDVEPKYSDKEICRPVFKIQLAADHAKFVGKAFVWIDADQLATDVGCLEKLMEYCCDLQTEEKRMLKHKVKKLLRVILAVIGAGNSNTGK